jgi:hypothetical protein
MTSVPEKQLAPCPFCGGVPFYERMGTARVSCIIVCAECGCKLETGEVWDCGTQWNTRVSIERAYADHTPGQGSLEPE